MHMTLNRMFLRGIVVSFFLCLTGSLAFGQDNRTWVSAAAGVTDPGACAASNICTRTAPCATFQCALAATNPGGEIDVLDSGDFGPVTINQSVSIVAQGVVAGIQTSTSTSSDAIDVIGSNVDVVLRGLTIDGDSPGQSIGIFFEPNGGVLHIEDCTIDGFTDGILGDPSGSSKVLIKDTIVRNNTLGIIFAGATTTASLDNVRVEKNDNGVTAEGNTTVSVRNSIAAGNSTGFEAAFSGPSTPAVINLESSIVSGNSADGILSDGANSTINITNVTVVNNGTGLSLLSGGHIVSFGNNKITDNTTNGSPTKTIAQK
jgi:hypothetical protein